MDNSFSEKISKQKVLIHFVIWAFLIITAWFQFYKSPMEINADFYVQWSTGIVLFYLNYFYFVPKFLLQRKYVKYFGMTLAVIVLFMSIRIVYTMPKSFKHQPQFEKNNVPKVFPNDHKPPLGPPMGDGEKLPEHREPLFFKIAPSIFYILIITISAILIILAEYYENEQKKLIAESHRTNTELIYLRKQTNPHFLFNSLNSIYSLAYKKSDLVPNAIVTLSELMRYMLYETDNKTVPLEKELNYIQNYIELQKLRLNDIENVTINIHGDPKDKFIEPLLLISFVENAFKYGTDYKGKTHVKIKIAITDNDLDFWIENTIENYNSDPENSGIGLTNIQNRLELLYPQAHQLFINQEDRFFRVHLILNLDKIKTTLN